jgi:hypothetical protein
MAPLVLVDRSASARESTFPPNGKHFERAAQIHRNLFANPFAVLTDDNNRWSSAAVTCPTIEMCGSRQAALPMACSG